MSKMSVAYARYSSDKQRSESVEVQIEHIQRYAELNDITINKYYCDYAQTGTNDDRAEYQKMLNDIRNDKVKIIFCFSIDRLNRNVGNSNMLLSLANEKGIQIIETRTGNKYNGDAYSNLQFHNRAAEGEYYSAKLSEDVKNGQEKNFNQNEHNGGKAPYGYNMIDKHLYINPMTAPGVKMLFNLYLFGNSYKYIADELFDNGYKTRKGKKFSKETLHDMLVNKTYCGSYVYRNTLPKDKNGKRNSRRKNPNMLIRENAHEAIITQELFNKVQQLMNSRKYGDKSNTNTNNYILNNHVICSECKSHLKGNVRPNGRKKTPYRQYSCPKHTKHECSCKAVNADVLEETVIRIIFDSIFENPDELSMTLTEYIINQSNDNIETIAELQAKLKEVNVAINRLLDMAEKGKFQSLPLAQRLQEREDEKKHYEKRIQEIIELENIDITLNDIEKLKEKVLALFKTNREKFVNIIAEFIDTIEVDNEKIHVLFKAA